MCLEEYLMVDKFQINSRLFIALMKIHSEHVSIPATIKKLHKYDKIINIHVQ
jgi:hypothetical protein